MIDDVRRGVIDCVIVKDGLQERLLGYAEALSGMD